MKKVTNLFQYLQHGVYEKIEAKERARQNNISWREDDCVINVVEAMETKTGNVAVSSAIANVAIFKMMGVG